jgi:hypothetical protein
MGFFGDRQAVDFGGFARPAVDLRDDDFISLTEASKKAIGLNG